MSEFLRLRQAGLEWRTLDGEVVALDLPRALYVGTNQSGRLLWEVLEHGATREQLVQSLVDEYGLERAAAERDVGAFVSHLGEQRLLETPAE